MTCRILRTYVLAVICVFSCGVSARVTIKNGAGDLAFDYNLAGELKRIPVYYYCPLNLTSASRVVFVMHSNSRPAQSYRDQWQLYAERHDFLLLCPDFSGPQFKSWEQYSAANLYDYEKKKYTPKDEWTFNVVEAMFDFAKKDRYLNTQAYCIFGHSAGAQFVHRMVLFMPDARFSLAIANGAGDYTMPVFDKVFSEGIKNTLITPESLAKSFGKELIIMVGEKDLVSQIQPIAGHYEPNDRFWRAKDFYQAAKNESEKLACNLKWRFLFVPDANHSSPIYAETACKFAARSKMYFTNPNIKDANNSGDFSIVAEVNTVPVRTAPGTGQKLIK